MAISDTLNSIKTNLENAYTSLENKQATIPANKNIENLASAIDSIQQGGGEQGEFVYIKQVANDDGYTMYMDSTPNGGEKYKITYTETDDGLIDIALEGDESKLDLLYANTEIIVNGQTMELNEYDKSYGLDRVQFISTWSTEFTAPLIDTSGVINTINGPLLSFEDLYLPNLLSTTFGFYNGNFKGSSIDLPKCLNARFNRFTTSSGSFTINAPECIDFYYNTYTNSVSGIINIPKCESAYLADVYSATISTLNLNSNVKWLTLYGANKWSYTTDTVLSFSQLEYFDGGNTGALYSGVSLPNVKMVGYTTFISWNNLRTISLPNLLRTSSTTSAAAPLFNNCSNLSEIYLPNFNLLITSNYPGQNITFSNLSNLEKVTLGSGTRNVPASTFYNCSKLSFVDFQNAKIIEFSGACFKNCYNLESINYNADELGTINAEAFINCYKLKEFYASSSNFRTLGYSCFKNCSSLSVLQLSVGTYNPFIYSDAFTNCINLSIFVFKMYSYNSNSISNISICFDNTPITNSALLGYYGSIYVENDYLDIMKYKFGSYSDRVTSLDNLPEGVIVRV